MTSYPSRIDSREFVAGRKCGDQFPVSRRCGRRYNQTAIRRAGEGRDKTFDFASATNAYRAYLNAERMRCRLDGAEHSQSRQDYRDYE